MTSSRNSMIVLVILQKLKIVPGRSISRQTKEEGDSLREYSVLGKNSGWTQLYFWMYGGRFDPDSSRKDDHNG